MATITLPEPTSSSNTISRTDAGQCRFCGAPLEHTFVNLGKSPLCESYLAADQLNEMEPFYPLHVYVCGECFLVQLQEYVSRETIFTEYAYFSSYSDSWLAHARRYTEQMIEELGLTAESQVIEVASNDGYLLQYFVERGVPALGIEPAANVAKEAVEKGVPTLVKFFGVSTAEALRRDGTQADLLLGNNVLAQVNDINDFVAGLKIALKPLGVITIEFPHLMRLVEENQFDTIYHEHFSYFSFVSAERIFAAHGLVLYDVEELPTHGGSLRIYGRHDDDVTKPMTERARALRQREVDAGLLSIDYYASFTRKVETVKRDLLDFLINAKRAGKSVAGYGAPGKGNTLLNYCGIRTDLLDFTVDRSPYKQGKFLPGTEIPIKHPDAIREARPDFVLILPWNLREEIARQLAYVGEWGGQLVVPIPRIEVLA
jgi:2-polyprenyl-3-methyl-5-hydroxy-6-metoxy-1,4-benzoquinol methylase